MIIINLIIDKSRLCYKITIKYDKTYHILNYTRIKPRSRSPQKKKSAYFTDSDFSTVKIEKKVRKLRQQIRYIGFQKSHASSNYELQRASGFDFTKT